MFAALAEQLNLPGTDAIALLIVAFIKSNSQFVERIVFMAEKYNSYTDHVENMRKIGVWGDGIVLEAALALFKRPLSKLMAKT
jgi:hypothetical protein